LLEKTDEKTDEMHVYEGYLLKLSSRWFDLLILENRGEILNFEARRWGIKLADEGLIPQKTLVNLHFYNQKLESLSSNNSLHKNTRKMPKFKHYLAGFTRRTKDYFKPQKNYEGGFEFIILPSFLICGYRLLKQYLQKLSPSPKQSRPRLQLRPFCLQNRF
jgi:hypothetical protein